MAKNLQDEQLWIEAFQSGEENALAHFFDLYFRQLCFFCDRIVKDSQLAEDIVSEVFVKLWDKKANFQTSNNIKAFLYISCRNACLNQVKSSKRKTANEEMYLSELAKEDNSVIHQIIESEFISELSLEIDRLPEKCRLIFKKIYFEGKGTDEIALDLDLSVKTVRNQKAKAVVTLRKVFNGRDFLPLLYIFLHLTSTKK